MKNKRVIINIKPYPLKDKDHAWGFYDKKDNLVGYFYNEDSLYSLLSSCEAKDILFSFNPQNYFVSASGNTITRKNFVTIQNKVVDLIFKRKKIEEALILGKLIEKL